MEKNKHKKRTPDHRPPKEWWDSHIQYDGLGASPLPGILRALTEREEEAGISIAGSYMSKMPSRKEDLKRMHAGTYTYETVTSYNGLEYIRTTAFYHPLSDVLHVFEHNGSDFSVSDGKRDTYIVTILPDFSEVVTTIEEVEQAQDYLSYNLPRNIPNEIWETLEAQMRELHIEKLEKAGMEDAHE